VIKQRLCLRSLGPERKGSSWEADRVLRLGRLTDLDLVLNDDSVSRQHAELALTAEGWVVRDLGSTNGTFLNGTKVGAGGQPLREGDIVQCGNVLFAVQFPPDGETAELSIAGGGMRVEATLLQEWRDLLTLPEHLARGKRPHPRLLGLLQIGRDSYRAEALDPFLESVLWEAAEALDAQHGCVVLRDPGTRHLAVSAVFAWQSPLDRETWLKNPFLGEALEKGLSLLCQRPDEAAGPEGVGVRSMICALLRSSHDQLGVLCLGRLVGGEPFDQQDLALADALALAVSGSIDNLAHVLDKERRLFIQTLNALAQMVELRRRRVGGQPRRVAQYALLLAEEMELSAPDCYHLRIGTPLLDLGQVGLSDALLHKPGPLSAAELAEVQDCVLNGAALLESLPGLAPLLPIIRNAREHWDGTGFPDNLAGEQIPLLARVVAVADAFAALTAEEDRHHPTLDEALAEIERGAGTRFDPACVQAFLRLRPRLQRVFRQRGQLTETLTKSELQRTTGQVRALRRAEPLAPAVGRPSAAG
jgi:HD-GYP domain-containing protein (c-di-GMP phosphodiesterase class II)